jgi:predicted ArsR family transcriptional regulator
MADNLAKVLADPGPHTAESLAERLPHFPLAAIREALETLAAQGVLERAEGADGRPEYRYLAPDRYVQADQDMIKDPAKRHNRPRRQ